MSLGLSSLGLSSVAMAEDGKKYRWKLAETWGGPNFPVFGDTTKKYGENG